MNALVMSRNVFEALGTSPTLCSATSAALVIFTAYRFWNRNRPLHKPEFSLATSAASLASVPLNLVSHPTLLPALCVAYLTIWNAYFSANRIHDPASVCMSTSVPFHQVLNEPFRLFAHPYFMSPKIATWRCAMTLSFALATCTHFLQKSLGLPLAAFVTFLTAPLSYFITKLAPVSSEACVHGPNLWLATLVGAVFILNPRVAFPTYLRKDTAITPVKAKSTKSAAQVEQVGEEKQKQTVDSSPVPLKSKMAKRQKSGSSEEETVAPSANTTRPHSPVNPSVAPYSEALTYGNPAADENVPRTDTYSPASRKKKALETEMLLSKEKDVAEALLMRLMSDNEEHRPPAYVKPRAAESRWLPLTLFLLANPAMNAYAFICFSVGALMAALCLQSEETMIHFFRSLLANKRDTLLAFLSASLMLLGVYKLPFTLGRPALSFASQLITPNWWKAATSGRNSPLAFLMTQHHHADRYWLSRICFRLVPLAVLGVLAQRRFPARLGCLMLVTLTFVSLMQELPMSPGPAIPAIFAGVALGLQATAMKN